MLPRILLLSAVVIWGWTFVATRILVAEIGPVEILTLRLVIGAPFLGLVLLARRIRPRLDREDIAPLVVGSTIFALHFLVQIAGIETTTATNTSWIITATPLVIVVLSAIVLHERVGAATVGGIAVATLGIVLLVSRGRLSDLGWMRSTGDWLVLGSTLTWALYTVSTRDLSRRRDPLAVTFAILLVAAALSSAVFVFRGDLAAVRALSPRGVVALLYLAIPGMALGQWFWQAGIAALGASRAGLYLYLEPVATMTLAVPLLGEPVGPFILLGGSLVLVGVWIGQRRPAMK